MSEQTQLSASEQKKEDWMNSKWRPMMGWMYMLVCTCDFVIFPVLWSLHQAISHGNVSSQWQPVTLQGAGLFHMAMGAVIGVAAFGRTQEKLAGKANDNSGMQPVSQSVTTTFGAPAAPSFSSPAPTPAPSFGATAPAVGKFGKVVPDADQPAL